MVIFGQVALIALISFFGSTVSHLLPIAIPPSVIGMLILLLLLSVKVVKLRQVDTTAHFLLAYMGVLFVPPIIAMADHIDLLNSQSLQFVVVIMLSTILTFLAALGSAAVVMHVQRKFGKRGNDTC